MGRTDTETRKPTRRALFFALLAVVLGAVPAGARSRGPSVKITYVANEGFLVETGSRRILVDALFDDDTIDYCHVPGRRTLARMMNASGPFEGVDLILVTHRHRDHFAPQPVLRHLASNPGAVLAGPPPVIEALRAEGPGIGDDAQRVRELGLDLFGSTAFAVNGIQIHAHRIRHSRYLVTDEQTGRQYDRHEHVENLAYLIEIGGVRLLHVGDAVLPLNREYFEGDAFPGDGVNVVFLEFFDWSDETKAILERRLRPDHVVFMHLPPGREKIGPLTRRLTGSFPNAVVFQKRLETRSFLAPR